jgi:hypothetical protein
MIRYGSYSTRPQQNPKAGISDKNNPTPPYTTYKNLSDLTLHYDLLKNTKNGKTAPPSR